MSHPPRDSGFTLIEVMTTLALLGILAAISVSGWSSWAKASAHSGAAREIQSAMRQAQQRAVTEGRAMCVWFDDAADTYTIYRGRCTDASKVKISGPVKTASQVAIQGPNFTSSAGTPSTGVTFQGRGTGSPGDVRIVRDGSSKIFVLKVDWLTGRVSFG